MIVSILILFAFLPVAVAEDLLAYRTSAFPNYGMVGLVNPLSGELMDYKEFSLCQGMDCSGFYSLASTLNHVPGSDQFHDVTLLSSIQAPVRYRITITVIQVKNGTLIIVSQKSLTPPSAMRIAGFPYLNSTRVTGAEDPNLIFVSRDLNPKNVTLKAARFDEETKTVRMPPKSLITAPDQMLESVRASDSGDFYGMVVNNGTSSQLLYKHSMTETTTRSWKFPETTNHSSLSITGRMQFPILAAGIQAPPKRLLLYRVLQQTGNNFSSSVRLQALDEDATGALRSMGPARLLTPLQSTLQPGAETLQSVSIEPQGRFAFYASYSSACKKEIVKAQKLNPKTGAKMGGPQTLVGCEEFARSITGAYGLDVAVLD
jgi:hypothetical protein